MARRRPENAPQVSDPLAEAEAWERWVKEIDPEIREQAAELLSKFDVTTKLGMVRYLHALNGLLLQGHYSPIVIQTSNMLVKDMLSVLWMEHQEKNAMESFSVSARSIMTQVTQIRQTQPTYLTRGDDDVMDAPALATAPAFPALEGDDE